jgi:hypothetical protein
MRSSQSALVRCEGGLQGVFVPEQNWRGQRTQKLSAVGAIRTAPQRLGRRVLYLPFLMGRENGLSI